jgi:hypothetical protein
MARRITTTKTVEPPEPAPGEGVRAGGKLEDLTWFILAVVAAIIVVRFVLLLFGARTGVPFVDFWYSLSAPFVAPFAGMFGSLNTFDTYSGARLELESVMALIIYSLLAYLIVLGIRLITPNSGKERL